MKILVVILKGKAEEGEKAEARRRGGNSARREKKKEGGEHFREEPLQK